jgi:hypothetical protein
VACIAKLNCANVSAREDAIRVKKLVSNSHSRRLHIADNNEGPVPSQRSVDSLNAVRPATVSSAVKLI